MLVSISREYSDVMITRENVEKLPIKNILLCNYRNFRFFSRKNFGHILSALIFSPHKFSRKDLDQNLHDCRGLQDMVSYFCSCVSNCVRVLVLCFSFWWSVPLNCSILDLATCKSDLVFFFLLVAKMESPLHTSDRSIREKTLYEIHYFYPHKPRYISAYANSSQKNF